MSSPNLRIIFMGTPDFAVPALAALAKSHTVTAVYTRPDAASGRGKTLKPSPVKALAIELGLPVHTPSSFCLRDTQAGNLVHDRSGALLTDPVLLAELQAYNPQLIVVAAYGLLLPAEVLNAASLGAINIHASLLPRWRGAAPIQRAILAGDEQTGVSLMRVTPGLDTGPYCATAAINIAEKDASALSLELSQLGADLLIQQLPAVACDTATWIEQEASLVTYAQKLQKQEVWLSPFASVEDNLRRVRAAGASAPARCLIAGRDVCVIAASAATPATPKAGQLLGDSQLPNSGVLLVNKTLLLACKNGYLKVEKIKPAGKQVMSASDFINGLPKADNLRWETIQ